MNQKRNFSFKKIKQAILLGTFCLINFLKNESRQIIQINSGFTLWIIGLRKRQIIHQINVQRRKVIGIFFQFSGDNLLYSQPFFFILFDECNLSHKEAKITKNVADCHK